jgi:hypothetical protein
MVVRVGRVKSKIDSPQTHRDAERCDKAKDQKRGDSILQLAMILRFLGSGVVWLTRCGGYAGDPFGFAQGRLFATPENRLRSG